jgi:dihydrofolate synthase/folylpolyglutamate synthase
VPDQPPEATYDDENTATAKVVLEVLKAKEGVIISPGVIDAALRSRPVCRFEELSRAALMSLDSSNKFGGKFPEFIVLDVAHNPDGISRLMQALSRRFPDKSVHIVIGLSSNKDVESCLESLMEGGSRVASITLTASTTTQR